MGVSETSPLASPSPLPPPSGGGSGVGGIWTERAPRSHLDVVLRSLRRDRGGMFGLALFALLVVAAIFAPVIAPHPPLDQNLSVSKKPPAWTAQGSWEYPLGTDNLGRDLFSRIVYGSRVSLTVSFFGVLIAATIGITAGLVAGYIGGRVDSIIMGVVNVLLGLPYLLFVVVIAAVLGRSLLNVILIFGITDSPLFVRVARGEVLRLREAVYVQAAHSIGDTTGRIISTHILPNMIGPMITVATFEMSAMIFYEPGLVFLGLSVPPEVPSWGNMLAIGRQYLTTSPWIATFPGVAIMITSLAMNLLGDWLRNANDPRLRR